MSQYDPENENDDDDLTGKGPDFAKVLMAAMEKRAAASKAMEDHKEKVELEAQKIAQQLRLAVYEKTDQLDGPSESEAFGALRQWRKAVDKLGPIMRRVPEAHRESVAAAIVSMVDLYKRETCPCPKCRAEREGRAVE